MKAKKFVKEFGWEKASSELSVFQSSLAVNFGWSFVDELKRLVESYELVKEHGTIERAKQYADSDYTAPEVSSRLKEAIADVEACQ